MLPELHGSGGRQVQFVAQLARVACAAHQQGLALPLGFAEGKIAKIMKFFAQGLLQHSQRFRPLQVYFAVSAETSVSGTLWGRRARRVAKSPAAQAALTTAMKESGPKR